MERSERALFGIVNKFFSRIHYTEFEILSCTMDELRNVKRGLQQWNNKAGVYYFLQNNEVKYVGRATPNKGLGSRVYEQGNAFGGKDGWDEVITDSSVKCGLIVFNDNEDWHWLASLEVLLIDKLKPRFNKRT